MFRMHYEVPSLGKFSVFPFDFQRYEGRRRGRGWYDLEKGEGQAQEVVAAAAASGEDARLAG